jgi:predicted MFS family arabinose efflux permease
LGSARTAGSLLLAPRSLANRRRDLAELTGEHPVDLGDIARPAQGVPKTQLTASLLWLLTITAGVSVANLYYSQPLLPDIARTFGTSTARIGILATLAQAGYASGLLFLAPLGDIVERRRLVPATLVAVALSVMAVAAAPTFTILCIASYFVGLTTIAPQLVVPFAAGLASPAARGRAVGHVMSGLLVGLLGGRVLGGFVGQVAGWRAVFIIAAILAVVLAAILVRSLPRIAPSVVMPYRALLRSLWTFLRTEPVLGDAALLGALFFAGFNALWTTLAFRLREPPLQYGSTVAGLFGLLGIAGALTAPIAGRIADRSSPRSTIAMAAGLTAIAWLTMLTAGHTLVGLAVGVVFLDAGTVGAQVMNQSRIYALPAEAHSRLNTVYMVAYFIGGSAGSIIGAAAWEAARWPGVCAVGLGSVVLAALVLVLNRRQRATHRTAR